MALTEQPIRLLFVIGSGLRDISGDEMDSGMRFIANMRTAPNYRLFSVDAHWAVLKKVDTLGAAIHGELVSLPSDRWLRVLEAEPPGTRIALVELEDGSHVASTFGDPDHISGEVIDITSFQGFAAFRDSGPDRGGASFPEHEDHSKLPR